MFYLNVYSIGVSNIYIFDQLHLGNNYYYLNE